MALKLKEKIPQDNEAKWFAFDPETQVQIVSIDNAEYQIAIERMRRRMARNDAQFEEGDVGVIAGEKTEYANHCLAIASFLLKDWTGAQDEQGEPIKYTAKVGAQMLEDNVDLFLFVLKKAGEVAKQARAETAETLEKPSPASSGKASGRAKRKSAS